MPNTHYQVILKELRDRFAQVPDDPDAQQQEVAEQVRQRFIFFLDADQTLSLEEVIGQLEQKWLADGLLGQAEELP
jgi:hypothetical protein